MQEIWKGLKTVLNFTKKEVDSEIQFDADKLNEFYAHFDIEDNREDIEKCKCVFKGHLEEETPSAFSENDVKNMFSILSGRKSAGPYSDKEKF